MKYDILIVDDEKIIIKLVKHLVIKSELHLEPKGFLGGIEALSYLNELEDTSITQIILLDINMPDFDGWDFLDLLEKTNVKIPCHVVIITSSINKSDKQKAKQYKSVSGYIEKPVNMENMEEIKSLSKLTNFFDTY